MISTRTARTISLVLLATIIVSVLAIIGIQFVSAPISKNINAAEQSSPPEVKEMVANLENIQTSSFYLILSATVFLFLTQCFRKNNKIYFVEFDKKRVTGDHNISYLGAVEEIPTVAETYEPYPNQDATNQEVREKATKSNKIPVICEEGHRDRRPCCEKYAVDHEISEELLAELASPSVFAEVPKDPDDPEGEQIIVKMPKSKAEADIAELSGKKAEACV